MSNRPPIGAYGLVNNTGFVPACIRLATRSSFSHAFVYVGGGWIVEAEPSGARLSRWTQYDGREVVWNLAEAATLTTEQALGIARHARSLVGTPYGFLDIAALGFMSFGIRWAWLERRAQREKRLICSQLCARSYWLGAGIDLAGGQPDATVTPGRLADRIVRRAGSLTLEA